MRLLRAVGGSSLIFGLMVGCHKQDPPTPAPAASERTAEQTMAVSSAIASAVAASQPEKPEYGWYGWLADAEELGLPTPSELLRDRISLESAEYSQSVAELGTFAEWLRFIPVMPKGTAVKNAAGEVVLAANDPHVAAVIEMDVDRECRLRSAFLPFRLQAEWLWATGERQFSFKTTAGEELPLVFWARGERPQVRSGRIHFSVEAAPKRPLVHSDLRDYLRGIAPFLDVGALVKHSRVVKPEDIRAGDMFVHGAPPGDAVIVFDVAVHRATKAKSVLLGRALDPCSSVYIVQSNERSAWFSVDASKALALPGMRPFQWSELRRLRVYGTKPERH